MIYNNSKFVEGGLFGLITLRVLMGFGEGTTFPAMSTLLAAWVPLNERGRLGAFALGGVQFGTIIGYSMSGFLTHYYGWASVFYVFGGLSILWFIIFVSSSFNNAYLA